MSAVIILSIGPVQSYISQARRTQDLWQGSRILSYLASQGVHYALNQTQAEVIYPSIKSDQTENIPNRVVVRWEGDESGARRCAKAVEQAIRDAWQTLSVNTLRYFVEGMDQSSSERVMKIWQRQEENWLECYWVVAPYDENSHGDSINAGNAALGARKLLRNFSQIHEYGRKCSITGEHEALRTDEKNYVEFWTDRKAEQRNLALLGKHERLSAISTIKRFAHEEGEVAPQQWEAINPPLKIDYRFPSTSSIAAAPFKYDVLRALFNEDGKGDQNKVELLASLKAFIAALLDCYDEDASIPIKGERHPARNLFFTKHHNFNPEYFPMINAISDLQYDQGPARTDEHLWATQFMCIDGDYLFEDTLITKTISEYMPVIKAEGNELKRLEAKRLKLLKPKVAKALKALKRLTAVAGTSALNISRPQPYIVILSMDGDHMGKTLGKLASKKQHRIFSETLANFAKEDVKRIVEVEHLGRVVYAGGDDVLALLPVRDALQVAENLRSEFEQVVAAEGIKNHEGKAVTASTGLAYVHHTHNLQDAVQAANCERSL